MRILRYIVLGCIASAVCGCVTGPVSTRRHSGLATGVAEKIRQVLPEGWKVEQTPGSDFVWVEYETPVRGHRLHHPRAVSIVLDLTGPDEETMVFRFGFKITDRLDPTLYGLEKRSLTSEQDLLRKKISDIPHDNIKAPMAERHFRCRSSQERRNVARYRDVWRRMCDLPELYTVDCGLKFFPSYLSPLEQRDRDYLNRYYRQVMSLFSVYEGCEQPEAREMREDPRVAPRTAGAFFLLHKASGKSLGPFNYEHGGQVGINTDLYEIQMDESVDQRVKDRMRAIVLPVVEFRQAHVADVINFLQRQRDEEEDFESQFEGVPRSLYQHRSVPAHAPKSEPPSAKVNDPFATPTEVGVTNGVPLITFSATNISLYDALVTVCRSASLELQVKDGMVHIVPVTMDVKASTPRTPNSGDRTVDTPSPVGPLSSDNSRPEPQ